MVVQAQVWVAIEHAAGQRDLANLLISNVSASCGISPYTWPVDVAANEPTDITFHGVFMQRPFAAVAGAYTFYFNGVMNLGQSAGDQFYYANLQAVFYPS